MEIQATFKHLEPTEALEKQIFDTARELNQLTGSELTWCHVVIEGRATGHRAVTYQVRVAMLGSRGALGVTHDLQVRTAHGRPKVAVAEAFDQVRSQILAELARREQRKRATEEGRPRLSRGERAVLSWA